MSCQFRLARILAPVTAAAAVPRRYLPTASQAGWQQPGCRSPARPRGPASTGSRTGRAGRRHRRVPVGHAPRAHPGRDPRHRAAMRLRWYAGLSGSPSYQSSLLRRPRTARPAQVRRYTLTLSAISHNGGRQHGRAHLQTPQANGVNPRQVSTPGGTGKTRLPAGSTDRCQQALDRPNIPSSRRSSCRSGSPRPYSSDPGRPQDPAGHGHRGRRDSRARRCRVRRRRVQSSRLRWLTFSGTPARCR